MIAQLLGAVPFIGPILEWPLNRLGDALVAIASQPDPIVRSIACNFFGSPCG